MYLQYSMYAIFSLQYILLKALLRVCMENTASGDILDKYSTRQSQVQYLS